MDKIELQHDCINKLLKDSKIKTNFQKIITKRTNRINNAFHDEYSYLLYTIIQKNNKIIKNLLKKNNNK